MKNSDLDLLLRTARVPDRADSYWAAFAPAVIRRLSAEPAPAPAERRWRTVAFAGLAAAVGGVLLGFFLWHRAPASRDPYARLRDGEMLREILPRYPSRLRAIVQDEQGLHIILSDRPDVPASMPIWIEISGEGRRRAAVTFSGQRVTLGDDQLEVLADPSGRVMLIGSRFFWSPDVRTGAAANLEVRVRAPAGNY
jgi:hypothetical protein